LEQFFSLVYGGSEGYVDIVTRSDEGELTSERWFNWPKEKSAGRPHKPNHSTVLYAITPTPIKLMNKRTM